jgi:hypothetical protein
MKKIITTMLTVCSFALHGLCGEVFRDNVTIVGINPVNSTRPFATWSQGLVLVYLNSGTWSGTGNTNACNSDRFLFPKSETQMLSTLLTAWSTGLKVKVIVDDGVGIPVKNAGDNWCTATELYVYN